MNLTITAAWLLFLSSATPVDTVAGDPADTLISGQKQAWGKLGINTAAVPPDGRAATPLQIGGTTYKAGLGAHADGEIVLRLDGEYQRFLADFGVQFQGGGKGSVVAEVWTDGVKRFESGRCTDDTAAVAIDVPMEGAQELRLVVGDAGDGIACDMADWCNARLVRDPARAVAGKIQVRLNGAPPASSAESCGFTFMAQETGPQAALLASADTLVLALQEREEAELLLPVRNVSEDCRVTGVAEVSDGAVEAAIAIGGETIWQKTLDGGAVSIEQAKTLAAPETEVRLSVRARSGTPSVRWRSICFASAKQKWPLGKRAPACDPPNLPPTLLPNYRPAIEQAWLEWDWRMQDGIGTPRAPSTYAEATERLIERGNALLQSVQAHGIQFSGSSEWQALRADFDGAKKSGDEARFESLWRRAHQLRRKMVFSRPLSQTGPLLFVKQVPSSFSHQLTQYYGRLAQPGGGLFVLDAPGQSMQCRRLSPDRLPMGSYMQPDVSYDGNRILFAYTEASPLKAGDTTGHNGFYHLYEMSADGATVRQLTEGSFDDFAPRYLPDGKLIFISTRRGGFHRCGRGPCPVYTLTRANADGSGIHTISYHETQEWDPAVLNDGRIIYTRWDYVDRNAVHYQQLWTTHPNGEMPLAYYGNNTFSPVGVWEARAVPGSNKIMATAAAHHAMTAGSILLIDGARAVDGMDALERLTPDAPFPESETSVPPTNWHAPGSPPTPPAPIEAERWPGHCYRSPNPLSEDQFLVAYSFDPLIGEPSANPANMFGLYLADRFGNKELLYRDPNISSLWPMPLRPRPIPPAWPDRNDGPAGEGTFFVQNVRETDRPLPGGPVKRLRVLQVLPKTTPNANEPLVGLAFASPGKQVLGTVPVEADGSALFRAPTGVPLLFQALDEQDRAVQTMRSVTYLQPGEQIGCVGCHDHRLTAPKSPKMAAALDREPSNIEPGPDGSRPLSYPLLVQPVLDKLCVRCHDGSRKDNAIQLTGAPQDPFTLSYNTLAPRVPFPEWSGKPLTENSEPATRPGFFGARASKLMDALLAGHHDVKLGEEDRERLVTWMDANALFYGTFKPEDQARQRKGERIAGPALE